MWTPSSLEDSMCTKVKLPVARNSSIILSRFCTLDELCCGEYHNLSFVTIESQAALLEPCTKLMDSVR